MVHGIQGEGVLVQGISLSPIRGKHEASPTEPLILTQKGLVVQGESSLQKEPLVAALVIASY